VSKTGKVTRKQRKEAWEELQSAVRQGMTRPFCRAINDYGLMFAGEDLSLSLSLSLSVCRKLVASVDTLWDTKGIFNGEKKQQKEYSAISGWCIVSLVHISMMAHPPTISAVTTQMV